MHRRECRGPAVEDRQNGVRPTFLMVLTFRLCDPDSDLATSFFFVFPAIFTFLAFCRLHPSTGACRLEFQLVGKLRPANNSRMGCTRTTAAASIFRSEQCFHVTLCVYNI